MAFAAPILPWLMAGSAALTGVATYQNSKYQSAVLENNANMLKQQADRETFAANQDIADKDAAARAAIGDMLAQMDASGISSTSGSMLLRRAGAESLATRDRERLSLKRDITLENTKNQENSTRAEAKATKRAGALSALSSLISIPTSYLSGATMVNDYNKGRLALTTPSYTRG